MRHLPMHSEARRHAHQGGLTARPEVRRSRRGRRRPARGATLVEAVIAFMVLFYLVMGGVEFGWYMYAKHMVQSAARDAARQGILSNATTAQVNASITSTLTSASFQGTNYTTTFEEATTSSGGTTTYATTNNVASVSKGNGLRVTISAPFSAFRVRPLGVIPANKTIIGVATMIKE
jgi:Flp pilus assembly protein TadG